MEERSNQLTVVVGASAIAEELRRSLMQSGIPHAGVSAHLRRLRRSMVLGENDLVVLCIALDQPTLQRHGSSLRQMMADHHCFPKSMRTVGLLTELGLTKDVAELGCDVFVHDTEGAARAIGQLTRGWIAHQNQAAHSRFAERVKHGVLRHVDSAVCLDNPSRFGLPQAAGAIHTFIHDEFRDHLTRSCDNDGRGDLQDGRSSGDF